MTTVHVEREIARPASEVFEYVSDFSKNPTWQEGMQRCEFTTDPPVRVGSRYDQVAEFLGREIVSKFEVTEYEEGRRVKATTIEGTFPITFQRTVEPIGEKVCRIEARVEGEARGFFRIFGPLLDWMVRRSINADYDRLKALLEG